MGMNFLRRLGPDPHANGAQTPALMNCPDVWELDTGDFAVIGIEMTADLKGKLPPTASCGPDERIVRGSLDATLTPEHPKRAHTNVGILASSTTQVFGTWSGSWKHGGVVVAFDSLVGFAEETHQLW